MCLHRFFLSSVVLIITAIPLHSTIIHVPGDFTTIQSAIGGTADGATVVVADGIYAGVANRNIDLPGKSIIVTSENGELNCTINCQGSRTPAARGSATAHSAETTPG